MDRKDLKIEHYRQRVAQLSVEYEDRIGDLRVEITELKELLQQVQEQGNGNGDAADPKEQEVEEPEEDS